MSKDQSKNKLSSERLKVIKHKGLSVLYCDFSNASREEGKQTHKLMVERLEKESDESIRLLINCKNTVYDPVLAMDWKKRMPLYKAKLKKSAIIGLSALASMALKNVLVYAKLMGLDRPGVQAKVFDNKESALDFLVGEK
jgi:hypothetical protein